MKFFPPIVTGPIIIAIGLTLSSSAIDSCSDNWIVAIIAIVVVIICNIFGRGMTWFDTGTMESLLMASEFVHMIEDRQCVIISAPEEIGYRFGWIDREQLMASAEKYGKSPYGEHLKAVAEEKIYHS